MDQNVDTRHVGQQHVRVDQAARTNAVRNRAHVREAVGGHGLGLFVSISDVKPDAVTREQAVGSTTPIRHDIFERRIVRRAAAQGDARVARPNMAAQIWARATQPLAVAALVSPLKIDENRLKRA